MAHHKCLKKVSNCDCIKDDLEELKILRKKLKVHEFYDKLKEAIDKLEENGNWSQYKYGRLVQPGRTQSLYLSEMSEERVTLLNHTGSPSLKRPGSSL